MKVSALNAELRWKMTMHRSTHLCYLTRSVKIWDARIPIREESHRPDFWVGLHWNFHHVE